MGQNNSSEGGVPNVGIPNANINDHEGPSPSSTRSGRLRLRLTKQQDEENSNKHRSLDLDNLSLSGRELLIQALGPARSEQEAQERQEESELDISTAQQVEDYDDDDDDDGTTDNSVLLFEQPDESLDLNDDHDDNNIDLDVKEVLAQLRRREENRICADCLEGSSTWASVTYGIFLCVKCVGAHRSLGTDISFAKSTTIDTASWSEANLDKMRSVGNKKSNEELEYYVPKKWPKPDESAPGSYRREYIYEKYANKTFSRMNNQDKEAGMEPVPWSKRSHMLDRTKSMTNKGKVEFVGIISIKIVKAEHLTPVVGAIPLPQAPSLYTNPYCVIKLGDKSAKTKVVNRSLNPVWEEGSKENVDFNISWDGKSLLKLAIWNNDKLGKDKLIGSALVDLSELLIKGVNPVGGAAQPLSTCEPITKEVWVRIFDYRGPPEEETSPTEADDPENNAAVGGFLDTTTPRNGARGGSPLTKERSAKSKTGTWPKPRRASLTFSFSSRRRLHNPELNNIKGGVSDDDNEQQQVGNKNNGVNTHTTTPTNTVRTVTRIQSDRTLMSDHTGGAEDHEEDDDDDDELLMISPLGSPKLDSPLGSPTIIGGSHVDSPFEDYQEAQLKKLVSASSSDGITLTSRTDSPMNANAATPKSTNSAVDQIKKHEHRRKRSFTKFHLRDKMKDALENFQKALVVRRSSLELLDMEDDEAIVKARREKGYYSSGKVLVEISFLDLR